MAYGATEGSASGGGGYQSSKMADDQYQGLEEVGENDLSKEFRTSNLFDSVMNTFNVIAGVSMLSLPYSMVTCGKGQMILLLGIGALTTWTALLLGRICRSNPQMMSYLDISNAVLGGVVANVLFSLAFFLELFLFLVSLLLLMGTSLHKLFPFFSGYTWVHISTLAVLPQCFLRRYEKFAWLGVMNLAGIVMLSLSLLYFSAVGGLDHASENFDEIDDFHPSAAPLAYGVIIGCYAGHSLLPSLMGEMRDPRKYPIMTMGSYGICVILYIGVTMLGVLMYGKETQGVVSLNFPRGSFVSKICNLTLIMISFSKYGLNFNPMSIAVENWYLMLTQWKKEAPGVALMDVNATPLVENNLMSICFRLFLWVATWGTCFLLPSFAGVTAVMGSMVSCWLSIIAPSYFYLKLEGQNLSPLNRAFLWAVILVGIYMAISGTIGSLMQMESDV